MSATRDDIIKMLQKSYCMELETVMAFLAVPVPGRSE